MNRGMAFALGSYLLWGILPVYWKTLGAIPALETIAHRVIWTAVFAAMILVIRRRWGWVHGLVRQPRVLLTFAGTAMLILANWSVYLLAINTGRIVESSLGYYMNPLVNVLLAVVFLHERPRRWQWTAIAMAALGVVYLTVSYGRLPWIALGLAFSFGFYALLKKTARLGAVEGLFVEMLILSIPMIGYVFWRESDGTGALGHASIVTTALLLSAGVVTGAPLLLFSAGAREVPLIVLGLLQYVAPTIQFVLGVAFYHEPFSPDQLLGFSAIWLALIMFTFEGFAVRRRIELTPGLQR